jgi:hypothetical protein
MQLRQNDTLRKRDGLNMRPKRRGTRRRKRRKGKENIGVRGDGPGGRPVGEKRVVLEESFCRCLHFSLDPV